MATNGKNIRNPMCGLWHANVVPSHLNDNGACKCINCFGNHCHHCPTYIEKAASATELFEKHICTLCMEFVAEKGR